MSAISRLTVIPASVALLSLAALLRRARKPAEPRLEPEPTVGPRPSPDSPFGRYLAAEWYGADMAARWCGPSQHSASQRRVP